MNAFPISCRCGDVAVNVGGDPLVSLYCHCDDCQAVHGAAYVPVSLYRADAITIVRGDPGSWKFRLTPRRTCNRCGTRLFAEPNERVRGVTAYLLPKSTFKPEFHIHCRFALLPIRDGLPHYQSLPARMGGSDNVVDW